MNEDLRIKREALKTAHKENEGNQPDEDYLLQRKQCKGCNWWRQCDGNLSPICHYYLIHGAGHRRDPGNGPGDCRSFEPKQKRSRKQIVEDAKKVLELIEKDNHAQQPRKGDGANG